MTEWEAIIRELWELAPDRFQVATLDAERDHFALCQHCGQALDMRSLDDLLHHEPLTHSRRPVH